jgi:adenosylcobinamide-phosphate synthase
MGGVPLDAEAARNWRRQGARAQGGGARLVGKVADSVGQLLRLLSPDAALLATGVVADLVVGDPTYAWHPVRLVGATLTWMAGRLRAAGLDGYGGGVLLFAALATISLGVVVAVLVAANAVSVLLAWLVHAFLLYSLLALGDLLHHVWRIERAVRDGDLARARSGVSALVGRDTTNMDAAACRRAAVESLSENLTDGFVSPLFWYVIAGIPGIVVFKVVSTMDSMVGYKTPRYLRFGWCGARLDDVMNYLPARITWLVIAAIAAVLPAFSGRKAWRVGLGQHGLLLGPNSGWSEAATAGALERQIVGPIWLNGVLVTDLWIGDVSDPPLATSGDVMRALALCVLSGLAVAAVGSAVILHSSWRGLFGAIF